jgi:hypothetical protein
MHWKPNDDNQSISTYGGNNDDSYCIIQTKIAFVKLDMNNQSSESAIQSIYNGLTLLPEIQEETIVYENANKDYLMLYSWIASSHANKPIVISGSSEFENQINTVVSYVMENKILLNDLLAKIKAKKNNNSDILTTLIS